VVSDQVIPEKAPSMRGLFYFRGEARLLIGQFIPSACHSE
jgi:hypothetical protein